MVQEAIQNYSFIVQDALQGFPWNSSQARLHPMIMYFKIDGADKHHLLFALVITRPMIHAQASAMSST